MAHDMTVAWRDEAVAVYEFLRRTHSFEEIFDEVDAHVQRLEADPAGHRIGATQRRVGGVMVWSVELGPEYERWGMAWTSPAPGEVMIEGIARL